MRQLSVATTESLCGLARRSPDYFEPGPINLNVLRIADRQD